MITINKEQELEIIRIYQEDKLSMSKIGKLFNISKKRISKILKKNNVKIKTLSEYKTAIFNENQIKEIIDLYLNKKINTYEIAKIYKTTPTTIIFYLKKNNIKIHPRGYYFNNFLSYNEKDIIELFNKNVPASEIAKKYNISDRSIYKILYKNNIMPKTAKFYQQNKINKFKDIILDLYINKNKPQWVIAKELGISVPSVVRILKENNIKILKTGELNRYNINQNYFEKIDCDEKAWIIGWLFSDGYLSEKNNTITLKIQVRDIDILKKIKHLLNFDGPIYVRNRTKCKNGFNGQPYCSLSFTSKKISDDLRKIGLIGKKSLILKFPKIDERYYFAFLKGYIEGDGWICVSKLNDKKWRCQVSFLATKEFLISSIDFFSKIGIRGSLTRKKDWKNRNINMFCICFSFKPDVIFFLDKIYGNNSEYNLKRKRDKYLLIKENYKNFPPLKIVKNRAKLKNGFDNI